MFTRVSKCAGIAFVCLAVLGLKAQTWAEPVHNVLVVHSYHFGLSWTDDIVAGIETAFAESGLDVEVYTQFLDTKRIDPDTEYFRRWFDTYSYAYRHLCFGAVILTDDDALNFALKYHKGKVPAVFCGASNNEIEKLRGREMFTGVFDDWNIKENVELALRMFPDTKQIVFVHDYTTAGREQAADARAIQPDFPGVSFRYINGEPIEDVRRQVKALRPGTVLMPLSYAVDKNGEVCGLKDGARLIATASPVPVFGFRDYQMDCCILGGLLVSGRSQGMEAGKLAVRILRGEHPRDIPWVRRSPAEHAFDWSELERFGVARSDLPSGSKVRNRPPGLTKAYWEYVVGSTLGMAILSGVITVLIINTMRRKRAEESLRQSEGRYRLLFERSPDAVFVLKDDRFIAVNPAITSTLGYSPEEMIGLYPWQISPDYQPDGEKSVEKAKRMILEAVEKGPHTFEWVHIRRDGREAICEVSLAVHPVGHDRLVQAIVRDVTERKRAEQHRLDLERTLDEQKRLFYRETILSVTAGKLDIVEPGDIETFISRSDSLMEVAKPREVGDARHRIEDYCRRCDLERERITGFMIGVGEAITNAIRHAGAANIWVGCEEHEAWVIVRDKGGGIESLLLPRAVLDVGFSTKPSLGIGFTIMLDVSDKVLLSTGKEGTSVVLIIEGKAGDREPDLGELRDTWDLL